MLVGKKDIDPLKLKRACESPEALVQFTLSLVPKEIRHVRAIVDNQKYYVATIVRSYKSLPYARKMSLCRVLLQGVIVKGVCNELFDYNDLVSNIDTTMFEHLLNMEER